MKLIYIANNRIPTTKANGKQIVKTCEALADTGLEVELWLPVRKQPADFNFGDPFQFYHAKRNFIVKKISSWDLLVFAPKLPLVLQTFVYYLSELIFDFNLITQTFSCNVVYTRSLTAALVSKLLKRQKTFYEIHNLTQNPLSFNIQKFFLQQFDGLIAISQGLQKSLALAGLKSTVIPDAADSEEYEITKKKARQKIGLTQELDVVVYAGSLHVRKGIATLQDAAKKFTIPNLKFLLVGGPILPHHEKNIIYTGFILPSVVPLYLCSADILVLPNSGKIKESREYTSPMKLFEYLAAGKPIIATATPANREVLTHLKNAYLIPPDDAQALVEAIKKILTDKLLASRLSKQSLIDATKHSWNNRAKEILEYIKP